MNTTKLRRIDPCFATPVIPVISNLSAGVDSIASASSVILQGTTVVDLPGIIRSFEQPPLQDVHLFVHLDLVSGLENNDAGLKFLAQLPRVEGVVTIHHHLMVPAKKLGLLAILRVFLSDSRALERGLKVIASSKPDVVDILPGAAAVKVVEDFRDCRVPYIAGGLCRTEADVNEALAAGSRAVTSTRTALWRMNAV